MTYLQHSQSNDNGFVCYSSVYCFLRSYSCWFHETDLFIRWPINNLSRRKRRHVLSCLFFFCFWFSNKNESLIVHAWKKRSWKWKQTKLVMHSSELWISQSCVCFFSLFIFKNAKNKLLCGLNFRYDIYSYTHMHEQLCCVDCQQSLAMFPRNAQISQPIIHSNF